MYLVVEFVVPNLYVTSVEQFCEKRGGGGGRLRGKHEGEGGVAKAHRLGIPNVVVGARGGRRGSRYGLSAMPPEVAFEPLRDAIDQWTSGGWTRWYRQDIVP